MSSFGSKSEAEVAQIRLIEKFMSEIQAQKAWRHGSYSLRGIALSLWKDDRIPLVGMEIPSSIGSTPVKVNWHECKVPADETWTVPIGDVVSGQHYHYGDVGFMISGWIKKVHITSYEGVERRIEGQTLYLTTSHRVGSESEPHIDCMPDLMESKFRIYPWMNIKNIVVTRRHIDPIARKLM